MWVGGAGPHRTSRSLSTYTTSTTDPCTTTFPGSLLQRKCPKSSSGSCWRGARFEYCGSGGSALNNYWLLGLSRWYGRVAPGGPWDMLLLSSPMDGGRQPWSNWLVSLSGYYSQDNIYALHLYWLSHRRTNTARLTTVYRNQHVIYICCGFGLVMSGVNLSGVIGRLSIYCKPTCTRVFIFGDRGEEWVGWIYIDSLSCNRLWLTMATAGRGYYLLVGWLGGLPYCGSSNLQLGWLRWVPYGGFLWQLRWLIRTTIVSQLYQATERWGRTM